MKAILFSILIAFGLCNIVLAQVPVIKYNPAAYYVAGQTIAPLSPVNTGGVVTGGYAVVSLFSTPKGGIYNISDNGSGTSYLVTAGSNNVLTISSTGAPSSLGLSLNKNSADLKAVVVHGSGNLFVSDYTNGRINKYSPGGTFISSFGNNVLGNIYTPYGITFDAKNNIYVADTQDGNAGQGIIFKLEEGAVTPTVYAKDLNTPWGIAFDNTGNLYVSQTIENDLVKITPAGVKSVIAGSFNAPRNLTADAAGNVFIADYGSNSIKELSKEGVQSTIIAGLNGPSGITFDNSKNMYIANTANGTVMKSAPDTFYTLTGSLPKGLSFNTTTGVISGTPANIAPVDTVIVTAYNPSGNSSAQVVFDVSYHLIDFTAVKAGSGVLLTWNTANEQNITLFTVQRSINNGITFSDLGTVTSSSVINYQFTDSDPLTSVNDQYRLKIKSADGAITYSDVVTISFVDPSVMANAIFVYPVPTTGPITLVINKLTDAPLFTIKVINSAGILVSKANVAASAWASDLSALVAGTYIIQVLNTKDGSVVGKAKFIKL